MKNKIDPEIHSEDKLILQLYVSGMSQKCMQAIENVKRICDEHLKDKYKLEIIDIYKNPEVASQQQIVFCPSLVKTHPMPRRTLVGNMSDKAKVIKALGITIKE